MNEQDTEQRLGVGGNFSAVGGVLPVEPKPKGVRLGTTEPRERTVVEYDPKKTIPTPGYGC